MREGCKGEGKKREGEKEEREGGSERGRGGREGCREMTRRRER